MMELGSSDPLPKLFFHQDAHQPFVCPIENIGWQKNIVNTDDLFLAERNVERTARLLGRPSIERKIEIKVEIVVEIGSGRRDVVDETALHQGGDHAAEARGRQSAGQ